MKKYSIDWKENEMKKHGGWAQKHMNSWGEKVWQWHYIQNNTEYSKGECFTKSDCELSR